MERTPLVRHNIAVVIASVDGGLEQAYPLAGYLSATKATNKLLSLPRKHRAAYHLYPSASDRLTLLQCVGTFTNALALF